MSTSLYLESYLTKSLCMSDALYWESIFPCDEELKPALKKRRLDYDDAVNVPQYCEMQCPYEPVLRMEDIQFAPILIANDNSEKMKDPSPTWEDFCLYIASEDPALVTDPSIATMAEPFIFSASVTSSEPRRDRRTRTESSVVVVGDKIRYSCHLCTKTFPTNRGLSIHLHSHKTQQNKSPTSKVQTKSPKTRQSNTAVFDSPVQKRFSPKAVFDSPAQKRFSCPLCERSFGINQDRLVHLVTGACTRADRFLRRITSGWECTTCDKVFDSRDQAERHTRTHVSGQRLSCPVCAGDFTGCKGNVLVKHVKDRHPHYFEDLGC